MAALALAMQVPPLLANLGGFAAATGVSYFGHHRWTFRLDSSESNHRWRLPRFIVVGVTALALSQAILVAVGTCLALPLWLALGTAVAIVPAFTYTVGRIWVFRRGAVGASTL
jgi:putative flippase GtrA